MFFPDGDNDDSNNTQPPRFGTVPLQDSVNENSTPTTPRQPPPPPKDEE